MSKSGSRLPPPPGKKGGARPLPPEPPSGGSGDAPPPLPSRPAPHRPGVGKLPPPPIHQNGGDESPTPEDETYEEPEPQQAPPSLPPSRNAPPALPSEPSQEVYDDLEDVVVDKPKPAAPPPAANGYMEETYDVCDIQEAAPHEEPELYEVPPEEKFPPPPEPEPEEEPGLYEFVPETQFNVPPPPSSVPTRTKLPPVPTAHSQPPLPARPPPQRSPSPSSSEGAPDLPGRPAPSTGVAGKSRKSSDGGSGVQINLQMLENRKANLKKVDSKEAQNPPSSDVTDSSKTNQSSDTSSVRDRILKLREAEKGTKPSISTKPNFLTSKPSASVKPLQNKTASMKAEAPPPTATVSLKVTPTPKVTPPTPTYDQEEVYDDGASYLVKDPLHQYDWYHGDIQRAEGDSKLQTLAKDGAFLIRKSSKGGAHPYTLVVLYQGKVYNLKVRLRSDTKVALGEEKTDEMAFKDVPSLIEHHKKNNVILLNQKDKQQYETLLTKSPIAIGR